jgi:VWFA-related protein
MNIKSKPYRIAGCCILAVTVSLPCATAFTQAPQPEHKFPTQANPRIVVSDASTISISPWEKNEVSIVAEVSGATVQVDEVKVKAEKNRLEINCVPLKPDRSIHLTLRVPAKSTVEVKNNGNRVEVKEPASQTNINASANLIQLNVPESSSLDMRNAPNAMEHRQFGARGSGRFGIGNRRLEGAGPTEVKVTAETAQVIVTRGLTTPQVTTVTRNPTIAATTIARRTSSMSKALGRSNPQLMRPQRDQQSGVNPSQNEEGAVKLETHLVNLNVSATDKDGKSVPGLKQEDFSIYEDGVLQRISFFSPERSPFNLVLLIDLSGSMKDEIELIKETAIHFLDVISAEDSVAVVTFTTDVTVVSHLTKDRDDLRESINWMLAPAGGTSFYDALGFALVEALRKVKGQRNAVIAITDGEDNNLQSSLLQRLRPGGFRGPLLSGSFLTFEELLDGATESDALIYPIHLNPTPPQIIIQANGNPPPRIQSPILDIQSELTQIATKQLRSLADASGGRFYHASRIGDLMGVFEQVAAELRTVYSMAYTPTNQKYDGSFRKIRVQASSADIAVRTRPGYYGR